MIYQLSLMVNIFSYFIYKFEAISMFKEESETKIQGCELTGTF